MKERIDLPGKWYFKQHLRNAYWLMSPAGRPEGDLWNIVQVKAFAAAMNERRSQPRGDIAKLCEALEAAQDYIVGLNKLLDGKSCREFDHKKVRWEQALAATEPAQQPAVGEPAAHVTDTNGIVRMIRVIRTQTGCCLKQAKDAWDKHQSLPAAIDEVRGFIRPTTPLGDVAMQAARDLHNDGMLYGYDRDEAQEKAAAIIQRAIQAANLKL